MAELYEALPIQADPRNVASLRRPDQRRGAGTECAGLGIANENVAFVTKVPVLDRGLLRPDLCRQQAVNQVQCQAARLAANLGVQVLEHHVVTTFFTVD